MKLRQDQLYEHLQKGLAGSYLVYGDDPLLVMEACDQIRHSARAQGIEERELFHAEGHFDWGGLREEANAMSLFASRRLLEVRLPSGKASDKGETLEHLISHPNPDNLLLVVCPRLDATAQRTRWFKAMEKHGVVLPIWPIERNQYPNWLKRRLQQAGLQADPAAIALLAQQTEGNLLAAVQEIEKLRLLGVAHIDEDTMQQATNDSARFDAFMLADACLLGNLAEASRILTHLQAEGVEAIMILGALNRKIRQLIGFHGLSSAGLADAFKKQGVWPKQQPPFRHALQRLTEHQLHACLQCANRVDQAIKGDGNSPWLQLSQLVIALTGVKLPTS